MKYPKEYEIAYKKAQEDLKERYERLGSYSAVAESFMPIRVSKGSIHSILVKGYRPMSGKIAKALGLPEVKLVPVVVNPTPQVEKPKRPRRKRLRVEIDPNTDKRTLEAIRDMDVKERTNILKAAVAIRSVQPLDLDDPLVEVEYGAKIRKSTLMRFHRKEKEGWQFGDADEFLDDIQTCTHTMTPDPDCPVCNGMTPEEFEKFRERRGY